MKSVGIGEMVIDLYRGSSGFAELEEAWKDSFNDAEKFPYWASFGWYSAIVSASVFDNDSFYFVTGRRDAGLDFILPIIVNQNKQRLASVKRISFLENPHLILRDAVANQNDLQIDIVSLLVASFPKEWDIAHFENLPASGFIAKSLERSACSRVERLAEKSSYIIDCKGDFKQNLSHLKGSFRRNLGRLERKAAELGQIEFLSFGPSDPKTEAVAKFIEIENDGWKGRDGSSIASKEELESFYTQLAESGDPNLGCRVNLLKVGQEYIAGQFGFVNDKTYFLLKIGFRDAYADIGAGTLATALLLRELSQDPNIESINLVTAPEWAEKWKSRSSCVSNYVVYNTTVKGTLLWLSSRFKKWAKTVLGRS